MILRYALGALVGYLSGSVMFAILLTKARFGVDVRTEGSGNAGATNVARVFGLSSGFLTFLGDALKTTVSALVGRLIGGETGALIAMAFCLLGHCFPLFFGFRGGKGVSVGAAIGLIIDWHIFPVLLAAFFLMFLLSHRVSLCSLTGAVMLPVAEAIFGHTDAPHLALGLFTAAMVWIMHRDNIKRLLRGEEKPFKPGSKKRGE